MTKTTSKHQESRAASDKETVFLNRGSVKIFFFYLFLSSVVCVVELCVYKVLDA